MPALPPTPHLGLARHIAVDDEIVSVRVGSTQERVDGKGRLARGHEGEISSADRVGNLEAVSSLPSCSEISPLFSKRSRYTNELDSIALGLVAASTVPPSSLRNRSLPGPKSLTSFVSNTPPFWLK
jgi:hypothetical protein